jgi:hypothetical protein
VRETWHLLLAHTITVNGSGRLMEGARRGRLPSENSTQPGIGLPADVHTASSTMKMRSSSILTLGYACRSSQAESQWVVTPASKLPAWAMTGVRSLPTRSRVIVPRRCWRNCSAGPRAGAAVAGNLVEEVADEPRQKLFRQELRSAPIEMKIDTVLVLKGLVDKVIGEIRSGGKLAPGLWVEIGVAAAPAQSTMPNAEIGQAGRVVIADWNIAGQIGHEIVDALVPFERPLWK